MSKISKIFARQIIDSRSVPTVETSVILDSGISGTYSVASGASRGTFEALELRDNDKNEYLGRGVLKAVSHVNGDLQKLLKGTEAGDQSKIDRLMIECDGTKNKERLGANSLLSVSVAVFKAACLNEGLSFYEKINELAGFNKNYLQTTPLFNMINGGLHGNANLTIQEFVVIPKKGNFLFSLQKGVEFYQLLKKELIKYGLKTGLGDEGGFMPDFNNNEEAIQFLTNFLNAISGDRDFYLGLDMAASTYFKDGYYSYHRGVLSSPPEYFEEVVSLVNKFSFVAVEDPFAEDDWDNWVKINAKFGNRLKIVADDLTVTNKERLAKCIAKKAANALIIKMNQIGTLLETIDVVKKARKAKLDIIISHRSGETNDDFIADLAVGLESPFVKFGAPARGERVAKYNRLAQIFESL